MNDATLIISTEYYANQPSVFLLIDGIYYGCLIYPTGRDFPDNPDYWRSATCSDSDRFFKVFDVIVSDENLTRIRKLQAVCNSTQAVIVKKSYPYIPKRWKRRIGKVYEEWKSLYDQQQEEIRKECEYNKPYQFAYNAAFVELRNLLLSLLPDQAV